MLWCQTWGRWRWGELVISSWMGIRPQLCFFIALPKGFAIHKLPLPLLVSTPSTLHWVSDPFPREIKLGRKGSLNPCPQQPP